jgi:pimeloyl-ACP methyl ester carboxylesterase
VKLREVQAGAVAVLALLTLLLGAGAAHAQSPLHQRVLVFIPAYEGSKLYDPDLGRPGTDPVCVWGDLDAIRYSKFYFALRNPNPLLAGEMLSAGPLDVYGHFVEGVTEEQDAPGYHAYTEGSDFFVFAYDWRQEIGSVTAPALEKALELYAQIHAEKTGIPAENTQFVLVAHSMGGLVARTFLSENPQWANRISGLYLVGTPSLGSVKAIRTLVVGPGGLKENALNFPASLLNFLPTNINANLTKLVAITRPSLYELLPLEDPHWECVAGDGSRKRISAQDLLTIGPWENYWPSAALESRLYINDWLQTQIGLGRKNIDPPAWQFCQDPGLPQLQHILAEVRDWRLRMGTLSYSSTLLTAPGGVSRLRLVVGTGLKTPTGVITEGAHDDSKARYTYEPDNDGDETVTGVSALDDLHPGPDQVQMLSGVTHGKLMIDTHFLEYLYGQLSNEPMAAPNMRTATGRTL